MYQVKAGTTDLSITDLGKILMSFQTLELPKLTKYKNYYNNVQPILQKEQIGTRPCNKIQANYCRSIVQNYAGYLTGQPIVYSNTSDKIVDILKYNDVKAEDSELMRNGLIYGVAYEVCWLDTDGKQRFKSLASTEVVPVVSDDLDQTLLFAIRFFEQNIAASITPQYRVEVYGPKDVKVYQSSSGFSSFSLIAQNPHFYGQCPVSMFMLNPECTSVFDPVLSLQDAYNTLISANVDDVQSWADAYLVFKGAIADDKDLQEMEAKRSIQIDSDADVSYLVKQVNDSQMQNLLKTVNDQIYNKANCVDFNDENFQASTGIALKLKILGMECQSALYESAFKLALQRRIELLSSIISVKDGESVWRDVEISFTRNLPTILTDTVEVVNALRGLVSDETLLGQLPIISDVDEELKKIEEQKQRNLTTYSGLFANNEDTEEN